MLNMINEIKREMEKDLLGINLDQRKGKIALHYYQDSFRNRFKTYTFVPRTSHNGCFLILFRYFLSSQSFGLSWYSFSHRFRSCTSTVR